eukprot:1639849-Amphidinium_carterae.1
MVCARRSTGLRATAGEDLTIVVGQPVCPPDGQQPPKGAWSETLSLESCFNREKGQVAGAPTLRVLNLSSI